ncbi:Receptor protein kinase FERONIA [Spatholobus suberectus]|nr:Receptor protein kinase FERONIA [Spatholobus suberectus]
MVKVSDFGLSKMGPTLDNTHVTTVVKGSFGYLDLDYISHTCIPADVLCVRPALNPTLDEEQVSLAEWAPLCYKNGMLHHIVDPHLKGEIVPECFNKFAETAMKCVEDQGIDRPSMGDVLRNLELALRIQESGKGVAGVHSGEEEYTDSKKDPDGALHGFDGNVTESRSSGLSVSTGGRSMASDDYDGLTPSAVFSQIINPKGR